MVPQVKFVVTNGNPLRLLHADVAAGDLMILGCVLCWTGYTLLARPVMRELSPLVTVTWSCVFGSALLLPFSLCSGLWHDVRTARWIDWAGLAYLGVAATSFAYYWYYRAIDRVGPVASGIFINLVPLFALFLGCVFLDEPLYRSQVGGGLMVIGGVVITVRASR